MSQHRHISVRTGLVFGALTLLLAGCGGGSSAAPAATTSGTPSLSPVSGAPAFSIEGLPGTLFYSAADDDKFIRLGKSGTKVVLSGAVASTAEVSPDGKRLAYVTESGDLMVANAGGGDARKIRSGVVGAGFGPSWSPDGGTLLIAVANNADEADEQPGTLRLADDKFTALPKPIRNNNIHFRLTGDGRQYFYSDGECRILHAKVDGTSIKRVPVLGDPNSSSNPRICAPATSSASTRTAAG
jgi:hypothetical protein